MQGDGALISSGWMVMCHFLLSSEVAKYWTAWRALKVLQSSPVRLQPVRDFDGALQGRQVDHPGRQPRPEHAGGGGLPGRSHPGYRGRGAYRLRGGRSPGFGPDGAEHGPIELEGRPLEQPIGTRSQQVHPRTEGRLL